MRRILYIALLLAVWHWNNVFADSRERVGVEGVKVSCRENVWSLSVAGNPFYINGVGGTNRLDMAKACGANAFRTWGGDVASIRRSLEKAEANQMYLMQGIALPKEPERYVDDDFKRKKLEEVRLLAETFKDEPALLAWGIGNEIDLDKANIPEAWSFVEELAKEIKKIDHNHLVSTVISHKPKALELIARYAPSLDFVGINSYGPIFEVGKLFEESPYRGPFVITEWGPTGWWETQKTEWGAPIEQTSEEKRIVYETRYRKAIAGNPRCLGSFVFLWGQKEERTPTWFSMFVENDVEGLPLKGEKTPMVEAMERVWTKTEPKQTAPVVKQLTINGVSFAPEVKNNTRFVAEVIAVDKEENKLTYVWEVLKEATITATGGAYEPRPERVGRVKTTESGNIHISIDAAGYYRLYVYVLDHTGYVSTANIPFAVVNTERM